MSLELDMVDLYDIYNSKNLSNFYPLSMESPETCNISSININPLYSCYHFICKECKEIPKIECFKQDKIKIICSCQNFPKEISIKNIFDYLVKSRDETEIPTKFQCIEHKNEKTIFYCKKCDINCCVKCINDCVENKHSIQVLKIDFQTINSIKYIFEKIKEKELHFFGGSKNTSLFYENAQNNSEFRPNDSIKNNENIMNKNNSYNYNNNNIQNNINIKSSDNNFQNNHNNENNSFEIKNDDSIYEDYYYDLFSIIINDFNNYPNSNNIRNISLIENYIKYYDDKHKEIKLNYQIEKDRINNNEVELFGEIFVNNNKDNFFLIIKENLFDLKRFINLEEIFEEKDLENKSSITLEVKLIEKYNRRVTDLSFMFFDIQTLHYTSDFSNYDMSNIENMSYMFYNCKTILSFPDISKWDTSNTKNMSYMFYNCELLKSLPDISKWNTSKVKDMSYMFYNCRLLSSFPDISKWNTSNIKNMDYMFYNCKSLSSLPEISQWKIQFINNMSYFYYNYKLLSLLLKNKKKNTNKNFKMIKKEEKHKNLTNYGDLKEEEKNYRREIKKMNNNFKKDLKKIELDKIKSEREHLRKMEEIKLNHNENMKLINLQLKKMENENQEKLELFKLNIKKAEYAHKENFKLLELNQKKIEIEDNKNENYYKVESSKCHKDFVENMIKQEHDHKLRMQKLENQNKIFKEKMSIYHEEQMAKLKIFENQLNMNNNNDQIIKALLNMKFIL